MDKDIQGNVMKVLAKARVKVSPKVKKPRASAIKGSHEKGLIKIKKQKEKEVNGRTRKYQANGVAHQTDGDAQLTFICMDARIFLMISLMFSGYCIMMPLFISVQAERVSIHEACEAHTRECRIHIISTIVLQQQNGCHVKI
eukprot:TRINITY_DN1260_c0_g3_i1.p1 TRINITY_DN1260_c0_g3~~TRINITY_DN1260_c0_g3_i1.p1  ORF type:complete len:142 (-),score=22.12 TRINITY_DN1260_c0_g3_i1:843-1268(-)